MPFEDEPLHRRTLEMDVFEQRIDEQDRFVVRSRLRDQRPWETSDRLTLHDIGFELEVDVASSQILRAEAVMTAFPHTECPLIAPRFAQLVGLTVGRGFSRALRERFGSTSGCAHLHELARTTGSAIVQAQLSRRARSRYGDDGSGDSGSSGSSGSSGVKATTASLLGMCHIWAPDGIGPRKVNAGWNPSRMTSYPALSVAEIEQLVAEAGEVG
jgi:hypothetical protein